MSAPAYSPSILVAGTNVTTAISTWVPTITPSTGAFTTEPTVAIASYTKIGKLVVYSLQFVLGDVGTGVGAGLLNVTLPSTSGYPSTTLLEEYATVGRIDKGNISAGGTVISIRQQANISCVATGAGFRWTGFYLEA
jgi:hypothetical protein